MPMPIFKLGDGDGAAAAFLAVARPARPCSLRGPGRLTRLRRVLCARCAMAAGSRASCSRAAGAEDPHGWAGEFDGFQPGLPVTTRGGDPPREGRLVLYCGRRCGRARRVPDVCVVGGVSVRRAGRRCAARTCRDVAWLAGGATGVPLPGGQSCPAPCAPAALRAPRPGCSGCSLWPLGGATQVLGLDGAARRATTGQRRAFLPASPTGGKG